MIRTSPNPGYVLAHLVCGVVATLAGAGAFAQAPKASDVPPPPKLTDKPTPADSDDAITVSIRQEGETKIEEFRTKGGRVYAVRVTPRVGKPYMLFDPDGRPGEVPASELLNGGVRPAQWTIFEF
jgi:Protein of unknown function (DUF2782)